MMNKEQKKNYISEMSAQFEKSEAVIVTHYQGLSVSQLDDLRKKMREHGIKFKITKNRITKLALGNTKMKDISNLFNGPTAVAISVTSGALLMPVFLRIRPESLHLRQSDRTQTEFEIDLENLPDNRRPEVFNLSRP